MRTPRNNGPLTIVAHPLGASTPFVRETRPADSSPGEIYPQLNRRADSGLLGNLAKVADRTGASRTQLRHLALRSSHRPVTRALSGRRTTRATATESEFSYTELPESLEELRQFTSPIGRAARTS